MYGIVYNSPRFMTPFRIMIPPHLMIPAEKYITPVSRTARILPSFFTFPTGVHVGPGWESRM